MLWFWRLIKVEIRELANQDAAGGGVVARAAQCFDGVCNDVSGNIR